MDRNFFIALALSLAVVTIWIQYQAGRQQELEAAQPPPGSEQIAEAPGTEPLGGSPTDVPGGPSVPATPSVPAAVPPAAGVAPTRMEPVEETSRARLVEVRAPLFTATLSTRGGGLVGYTLAEYFDASRKDKPPVQLTTLDPGDPPAFATPFDKLGVGDLRVATFELDQPDAYTVVFNRDADGVGIRKTFRFDPETYLFRVRLEVSNRTDRSLSPAFSVIWPGRARPEPDFSEYSLLALTDGDVERQPVGAGAGGFLGFGGGSSGPQRWPEEAAGELDWVGAGTRYFLQAMIPDVPRDAVGHFLPVVEGESAWAVLSFRTQEVPPGQAAAREIRAYLGPKESERLEAASAHLERSIELGWSFIAPFTRFFTWLLDVFHGFVPNYGVAIILVTVLMRAVIAPLTVKQMRSMKKMGELQPKMKALQEKYADDRQKQSEEMMKLYKTAGVNPLGGCLPMVLQMPAFIGLFYALQSAIHLRQEPFVGWINDLSQPEQLFVLPGLEFPIRLLPVIMGGSMILQQKMTPTTMDPAQARMMMIMMPIAFTFIFYQFPSGLVLYWLVSNLLGIAHQLWMNRTPSTES